MIYRIGLWLLPFFIFVSCKEKARAPVLFEALNSKTTGLAFSNQLNSSDSFNLFKYMYFYNGAGVGAGDFNNDGLIDIFFASNQKRNTLYLNQGNLKFKDVTDAAMIPNDNAWSTGVSIVDINNDGLLDIYISRLGKFMMLKSHNQFLICKGIIDGVPQYEDQSQQMGVDFSGFGTQAAFLDFDVDGDLDMFLVNHSIHHNSNFRERKYFEGTFHPESGSRFYRNDNGKFTDLTKNTGINSTAIGYGLGIAVSDINLDGYPDVYIGNDFHENDYLYINQRNGTFKDVSAEEMMHTSQYTMGVDVADASNDGLPEIVSVDMLPEDPYILKRSLGEDNYDIFFLKINYGYNYQYTRNNLQYNRGNSNFSETGLYSGVAATDWSWSPLWMDFDNDGLKDLFISNGIPKRMNDIDYINYVSAEEIQQKINLNKFGEKDAVLIEKFPKIKIPNKFYHNKGSLQFADMEQQVGNNSGTYSNGAVYADFDNDGDLDIVVNNIDEDAILYRNTSNDAHTKPYLSLKLDGPPQNRNALGAKVVVYQGSEIRTYEKTPVRGFLSSTEGPLHIGMSGARPDSMFVVWPDNSCEPIIYRDSIERMSLVYKANLPKFNYSTITRKESDNHFTDITSDVNINYAHTENKFSEFDREPLMPHMISTEGPALAIGDINGDERDDIFIGSSKGKKGVVYLQGTDGRFSLLRQPDVESDSSYEDVDAVWADINGDKHPDLVVASGGNEYYGKDKHLLPRAYLNDGAGRLTKKADAFDSIYNTSSCVAPYDFNNDGYIDLFIGGRAMPWEYGKVPPSYLLQNDGTGKFVNVTEQYAAQLSNAGFVTRAVWVDINADKVSDLVICAEWGTIDAYINKGDRFEKQVICDKKGWWNTVVPCDINGDGNVDFIAGNLGLNSRLKASDREPVRLYYNDFDDNGKKEQLLTYYLKGKEIVFANKSEIERQMPGMRKKFLYAKDFAMASLKEIIGEYKLESAALFSANYFANCLLINKGNNKFEVKALPWESQLSPLRDAMTMDANNDGIVDIMAMGNYYSNNIEMGRYDAGYGTILINDGGGNLRSENIEGIVVKGETRRVGKVMINGSEACIIVRNNDSTLIIKKQERKLR